MFFDQSTWLEGIWKRVIQETFLQNYLKIGLNWLIDWGLTPFLTISHLYHGGQFTYSCISWFSHTSTPHNNLSKQQNRPETFFYHPRNISTKLFENMPTSLGEEEFWSFFHFVAMETKILHGSQKFEGNLVRSLRGCFLRNFIPIDPLVTEEKKLTHDGQRTPDKRRSQ